MGNFTTRIEGAGEKLVGNLKATAGKLLADPRLQVSGRAKELTGAAKESFAKTVGWTRGKVQSVLGFAQRHAGSATNNADVEAAGVVKQVEGEVTQTLNN